MKVCSANIGHVDNKLNTNTMIANRVTDTSWLDVKDMCVLGAICCTYSPIQVIILYIVLESKSFLNNCDRWNNNS
jgi:hypothetical protein